MLAVAPLNAKTEMQDERACKKSAPIGYSNLWQTPFQTSLLTIAVATGTNCKPFWQRIAELAHP